LTSSRERAQSMLRLRGWRLDALPIMDSRPWMDSRDDLEVLSSLPRTFADQAIGRDPLDRKRLGRLPDQRTGGRSVH
jgi:hypothetical protein